MGLANGVITFTASGYADAAGNVGTTITEENADKTLSYNVNALLSQASTAAYTAQTTSYGNDTDATQVAIDTANSIISALAKTGYYPTEVNNLETSMYNLQLALTNKIAYNSANSAVATAKTVLDSGDLDAAQTAIDEAKELLENVDTSISYSTEVSVLLNRLNDYQTSLTNKIIYNTAYNAVRVDIDVAIATGDTDTILSAISAAETALKALEETGAYTNELATLQSELDDFKTQYAN